MASSTPFKFSTVARIASFSATNWLVTRAVMTSRRSSLLLTILSVMRVSKAFADSSIACSLPLSLQLHLVDSQM